MAQHIRGTVRGAVFSTTIMFIMKQVTSAIWYRCLFLANRLCHYGKAIRENQKAVKLLVKAPTLLVENYKTIHVDLIKAGVFCSYACYLEWHKFATRTDSPELRWTHALKQETGQLMHRLLRESEIKFGVQHKGCIRDQAASSLSRLEEGGTDTMEPHIDLTETMVSSVETWIE